MSEWKGIEENPWADSDERARLLLRVSCGFCGAGPGEPCVTRTGRVPATTIGWHTKRYGAAGHPTWDKSGRRR